MKTVKIYGYRAPCSFWTRPSAPGCGDTLKALAGASVRSGVEIVSKTAPGSLSAGSPAGRTPPHGDGSMYSQANVRVGKCAAAPYPSVASVIVDTEKVLRGADGSVERKPGW